MSSPPHVSRAAGLVSRAAGWSSLVVGIVVIGGWALALEPVTSVVPGLVSMKVNTALCLVLLAIPLVAGAARWTWVPVTVAGAVAAATIVEYAWGVGLGIDELFFLDATTSENPGRMAVATAVGILLLVAAEVALRRGSGSATCLAGGAVLVLATLALLGYLYGAEGLYAVMAYTTMAVNTAAILAVLAVGTMARTPGGPVDWLLSGTSPGPVLMRRLLPVTMVVIPGIGYVRLAGQRAGWFGLSFGLAVMVAASCAAVLATGAWVARRLDASDRRRDVAETHLQRVNSELGSGRDDAWARVVELGDELAREQVRFARSLEQLDDVVWSLEVDADVLVERYVSPNSRALLGGEPPAGAPLFQTVERLVHPADAELFAAFLGAVLQGRDDATEVRLVGLDGTVRWVWLRGRARRDNGRISYDGIATDVTERHVLAEQREQLLEQERAQRREAEAVRAMREEFVANAGHELRTPITVVMGYADLLLMGDDLNQAQRAAAETIRRRTGELGLLVQDLFDLARLRAGATRLTLAPTRVDLLLEEAATSLRPQFDAAGVRLVVSSYESVADADSARLRQVVDNLLTNAVKYTPTGGTVMAYCASDGEAVTLTVSDDGIGIAEEDLPRLFERFFRAGTATAHEIPGTGLGLAIVKDLVQAHGGDISVAPAEGGGTCFAVTLPRVHPTQDVAGAGAANAAVVRRP